MNTEVLKTKAFLFFDAAREWLAAGQTDSSDDWDGVQADVESMQIAKPILVGTAIVALFFGGLVGWAAIAPISSAAIAPGTVSIDNNRKTIQHLEGGIVKEILVRDGDVVEAGQVLIRLDDTQSGAKITLLGGQIEAQDKQLELLREEITSARTLVEKKLAQRSKLSSLMRREAEIEGEQSRTRAQLLAAQDVLTRSKITAPLAGTIVGLQVHSAGGVINRSEALLYIVPSEGALVIEARIDPLDIDIVHAGLPARVRLTAYNQRNTVPIEGSVISVSADSMTDEQTGKPFYLARVELLEDPSDVLPDSALYPGMPAEVMIVTGERTALEYIFQPFARSLQRAFREG